MTGRNRTAAGANVGSLEPGHGTVTRVTEEPAARRAAVIEVAQGTLECGTVEHAGPGGRRSSCTNAET